MLPSRPSLRLYQSRPTCELVGMVVYQHMTHPMARDDPLKIPTDNCLYIALHRPGCMRQKSLAYDKEYTRTPYPLQATMQTSCAPTYMGSDCQRAGTCRTSWSESTWQDGEYHDS